MTYNFDPDSWYRNHSEALRARHDRGELSAEEYAELIADLDRRYEEMLARLDGSFQFPVSS